MKKSEVIKKTYRYLLRELKFAISKKPYFLNFPAATLCNHNCVMCNIHLKTVRDEMNLINLEKTIKDPLFTNIESIGLSGGEPFMKKDLVDVVSILVNNLKNLKHFSINSNGQLPNRIKEWLPVIKEICIAKKVNFNMVLSMDGVEEVHNKYRGKENAWKQLSQSFKNVFDHNMTPSILMTIHKNNYPDVFNVFSYCKSNNISPYFGIATIIERLGNTEIYDDFILTDHDKYYIWEFLQNLSNDKSFPINKRIWYDLLSYQLLYKTKRTASCVAQKKGVYLGDNGLISYCGVYDKELQNYNNQNYLSRFNDKKNITAIRNRMIDKHCNSCMHDYQSKPQAKDILRFFINEYKLHQLKKLIKGEFYRRLNFSQSNKSINSINNTKQILLYGWFGTETIGDKAIYAEIINYFKNRFGQSIKFTIISNMIAYTERTLIELNITGVEIVEHKNVNLAIKKSNLLVYCGGPIMGYTDLYDHYYIASKGKKLGKQTMIYGAGFGPLKNRLYKKVALKFIKNNDIILLRDKESIQNVNKLITLPKQSQQDIIIDPAYIWALEYKKNKTKNEKPILGISFRTMPDSVSSEKKIAIFSQLANHFIEKYDGTVNLIPMNTYHVGGDDRVGLYKIKQKIEKQDAVNLMSNFYTPDQTIKAFAQCDYFVGVRFHSNIFANALSIPTVGVEYVLPKGKITSLYNTLGLNENLISIDNLQYSLLEEKLENIISKKETIIKHLENKSKQLKENYYNVLNGIFINK